jgi:GNAT superfamily N-acetyltransferase
MKIVEYDDVDPLKVLELNLLALGFPLTPEYAAHIRRTDARPFPFLAIYAVEDDRVLGQVGIFRLPMVSIEGREDVGGVWAVSTHPEFAGRGVASCLLEEAHNRMREAGLRYSTLGTNRFRVAYNLYRQQGYEDMRVWAMALAPWDIAHQPTRLRAQRPGVEGYDFIEKLFERIAGDYLAFSWRHTPFFRLRDKVALEDVWILWMNELPVGYAFAKTDKIILNISCLLLANGINAGEAVAAVVANIRTEYVWVKISRPIDISNLRRAGYKVANPNWDAFMMKPLIKNNSIDDARRLFGFGTDKFLISWLDET